MKKLFILMWLILGVSIISFGQVSATATTTATIITPITIANQSDMNFGNISVSSLGGTVILSPSGIRSITGGVTLPNFNIGTVTTAVFKITGTPNFTFYITLPTTSTVVKFGTNQMIVNGFTSNPSLTGEIQTNGEEFINVGATLTLIANQVPGVYVSDVPFTVTVNYN